MMSDTAQYTRLKRLVWGLYGNSYTLGRAQEGNFRALLSKYVVLFTDDEKRRLFQNYYLGENHKIRKLSAASVYVYLHYARLIMKHILSSRGKAEVLAMCSKDGHAV